jgi:hypothetical protein
MKNHLTTLFFTTLLLIDGGCAYSNPRDAQNSQTSSVTSTAEREIHQKIVVNEFPKSWGEFKINHEGPLDTGKRLVYTFDEKDIRIAEFSHDYSEGITEGLCLCFKTHSNFPTSSASIPELKNYISQTLNSKITVIDPQIINLGKNLPALLFYTEQTYALHQITAVVIAPQFRDTNNLIATIGLSSWQDTPYKDRDINNIIKKSSDKIHELTSTLSTIIQN